jgi:hypothetical protein
MEGLVERFIQTNRLDLAATHLRSLVQQYRARSLRNGEAVALAKLGNYFVRFNERDSALTYFRAALQLQRASGYRAGELWTLRVMGDVYTQAGQLDSAIAAFRRAAWLGESISNSASNDFLRVGATETSAAEVNFRWASVALRRGTAPGRSIEPRAFVEAWVALERGREQALRALKRRGAPPSDSAAFSRVDTSLLTTFGPLRAPRRMLLSYALQRDTVLVLINSSTFSIGHWFKPIALQTLRDLIASVRNQFGSKGIQRAAVGSSLAVGVARSAESATLDAIVPSPDTLAPYLLARVLLPPSVFRKTAPDSELVIITDALTSLVPWAALPIDSMGTPLSQRYVIRVTPSASTLAERRQTLLPRNIRGAYFGRDALVVGDPAMPPGEPPLPGARAEATWVADTVFAGRRVTLLTGRQATVRAVRERLATASLIHLATHAAVRPDVIQSRGSYLQFAAVDSLEPSVLTVGELLDAAESGQLRLQSPLVVLSACETGIGATSTTEGVLGLQRAFLALGAQAVLVGLWKVDDAATRALMGAFYRHLLDDLDAPSAAAALRRAQADMRSGAVPGWIVDWAKPNAWAAFQVVGAG